MGQRCLGHRNTLSGQHRFVDGAGSSVDQHGVATKSRGSIYQKNIARHQLAAAQLFDRRIAPDRHFAFRLYFGPQGFALLRPAVIGTSKLIN